MHVWDQAAFMNVDPHTCGLRTADWYTQERPVLATPGDEVCVTSARTCVDKRAAPVVVLYLISGMRRTVFWVGFTTIITRKVRVARAFHSLLCT